MPFFSNDSLDYPAAYAVESNVTSSTAPFFNVTSLPPPTPQLHLREEVIPCKQFLHFLIHSIFAGTLCIIGFSGRDWGMGII